MKNKTRILDILTGLLLGLIIVFIILIIADQHPSVSSVQQEVIVPSKPTNISSSDEEAGQEVAMNTSGTPDDGALISESMVMTNMEDNDYKVSIEKALNRAGMSYSYVDNDNIRVFDLVFDTNYIPQIELRLFVESDGSISDRICLAKNIDPNKQTGMLLLINQMNERYRFAKFVLDKNNDLYIYREDRLQSSSDECCDKILSDIELLMKIVDDSLPDIMRLTWGDSLDEV